MDHNVSVLYKQSDRCVIKKGRKNKWDFLQERQRSLQEQITRQQFDLAIYSGLYATFYYMQACYPYLKETQGSVINFASGAGLFGNYGQCAYAAAKEGVRGLTRVAATEWGADGINVNIVCPLASPDFKYMNGETITLEGGMGLRP